MKKSLFSIALSLIFVLSVCMIPVTGYAATLVRQTDVTTASEGNVLVSIRGTFSTESAANVLKRINELRYEACQEGVPDPRDPSRNLTKADYNPIKWSSALEKIAQTRAAEASVIQEHTRPNGTVCFTCTYDGQGSYAEDLAWNNSGMMMGIEQWYGEKAAWVNKSNNAVTGHYTSMINPGYNHMALGCFQLEAGGWVTVSGEFTMFTGLDEAQVGVSGLYDQMIEVPQAQAGEFAKYAGTNKDSGTAVPKQTEQAKQTKKTNPLKVKAMTQKVRFAKVKKKNQIIAAKKAFSVTKAQGKVSFKVAKYDKKAKKKITVSTKGKVKVKKGLKKGTYKVKVQVRAAGNSSYNAGSKTVTLTIKVK